MPTIISGLDPSVRMNAYLQGQKFQTQLMAQQAEEQKEAARQRQEFMRTMQNFRAQEAKALGDVNMRAQLGQAQAIQQQMMAAEAAGLPPDQKMAMEATKMLEGITDPEIRAAAARDVQGYLGKVQKQRQLDEAMKAIEKAIADGHISPEEGEALKAEAASGRGPGVVAGHIRGIIGKKNAASVAMSENEEFAARAEELVKSAPKGTKSARRAMFAIQEYRNSPTDQQSPGAGASLLKKVQEALILEADEERQLKREKKRKLEGVVPGTGGQNLAAFKEAVEEGDSTTSAADTPGTHATLKGLKAGTLKPKDAASVPQDPASAAQAIIAQMRADGIPITLDNLQAIKAKLRGQGAAPAGTQ